MQRLIRPVGLVIVAAVLGYVLARSAGGGSSSPDALTHSAQTVDFTIHYPSSWSTSGAATVPGLALERGVAIAPANAGGRGLAMGTIRAATVGRCPPPSCTRCLTARARRPSRWASSAMTAT
jgi:hypothetical protein